MCQEWQPRPPPPSLRRTLPTFLGSQPGHCSLLGRPITTFLCSSRLWSIGSSMMTHLCPHPSGSQQSAFLVLSTEPAGRWSSEAELSCRHANCISGVIPRTPSSLHHWGENPWFWAGVGEATLPSQQLCPARPAIRSNPRAPQLSPANRKTAVLGLGDRSGDSGLRRKSIPWDDECLFLSGALGFLHGSQDTCKSPFRTLIYMASTRITDGRILPALTAGRHWRPLPSRPSCH